MEFRVKQMMKLLGINAEEAATLIRATDMTKTIRASSLDSEVMEVIAEIIDRVYLEGD